MSGFSGSCSSIEVQTSLLCSLFYSVDAKWCLLVGLARHRAQCEVRSPGRTRIQAGYQIVGVRVAHFKELHALCKTIREQSGDACMEVISVHPRLIRCEIMLFVVAKLCWLGLL
eukprot:2846928-Amphidinium_carterae.1